MATEETMNADRQHWYGIRKRHNTTCNKVIPSTYSYIQAVDIPTSTSALSQ